MLTRRVLLGRVTITTGAILLPASASAVFVGKISWKSVLAVVANAATILEFALSTLSRGGGGATPAPKPRICSANLNDLFTINRLCFSLSLVTNTKDNRVTIEIGDGGLLPALADYSKSPSESTWRRVSKEAHVFMSTAQQLLHQLGRSGGIVEVLDPDDRARVLNETHNGLRVVDDAIRTIYYNASDPDDPTNAQAALTALARLPEWLDRAQRASAELSKMRLEAKC
jgi:hypothetical protein